MDKEYLLFDLDGTITDPKLGITRSVAYSLRAFGIEAEPVSLVSFIGPPLRESYKKYYSFSDAEAESAVKEYRDYFSERGIFENTLYDGMDTLLLRLHEMGRKLVVATSKPTVYAERILVHFGIDKYFTYVSGSELDGRRSQKDEVISYALLNLMVSPDAAVMIGDREFDIIGAKKLGVKSIGVLYGYGSADELADAGATHIVDSVDDLSELLMGR